MKRNSRTRLVPAAAGLLALFALCGTRRIASSAELDKNALYRHLRKAFLAPPGVEFELKDLRPSPIPGFQAGVVELRFQGKTQRQPIHISQDGRHYILSDAFALAPSKVPGLLGPKDAAADPNAAQVHVATGAGHFLVGPLRDVTEDPDAANLARMNLKDAPSRGPQSAPLVFVEFSDLQCPFCSRAHQALEQDLLKTYGEKIRWVWKHYPLTNIHPWAYNGAVASACAFKLKPEAVWKVNEAVFEQQAGISLDNVKEKTVAAAKAAGVDGPKFAACVDKQESRPLVDSDMKEGSDLGVDSTPTFFINGRKVPGFRDFPTLKAALDAALAEAAEAK